ncbi:fucose 4-O-acetylase [Paenibacillus albiflavus]|uniref:Fucose 4-O-acetylase n=1 Tax=Paenibacillus albiflavus TaxID=2545760 RepID=A0A4R4EEC4_9BACL|nr:fucose 4-O-acetylase [Paenibacillus albiflavus]TCZ77807.1 fucose 4-O-acetylase [Paenibacillus albiflavus]
MSTTTTSRADTFCLNLRFLLIVTVFVANAIEPLIIQHESLHALYVWIFTFHMPLFVFVTGYFAKNNLGGPEGRKILMQIVVQYVIFQSFYSLMQFFVFRTMTMEYSFFIPYLLLWFLVSHLSWRILLPIFAKFKHPILFAIVVAVLIGYGNFTGTFASISRTFVYLPFFMIGYYFDYSRFVQLFTTKIRLLAGFLSIALLAVIGLTTKDLNPQWLFGSFTFSYFGYHEWYVGIYRLLIYTLELIAAVSFLAFVPQRISWITDFGRRTVYVFLLHELIIRSAVASGIYKHITEPIELIIVIAAAIGCTLLLSLPITKKLTHLIIEPKIHYYVIDRTPLRKWIHRPTN